MFHGRKKEAHVAMSDEEQKQNEQKLAMILQINKAILAKKAKKEYDAASLAQTEKFAMIASDFLTLWNYRRDILTAILASSELPAKMELVGKELEFLIKSIKRSPKSYTLWYHRQWIIELGLGYERETLGSESTEWKSKILEMELQLCNKML
jgi:geranylgeranyl transferase type-2 subunit alpha